MRKILRQRDAKLAEAQQAQADLLRKQRELDDAKRELSLTVEKRVQEGLATTRQQARKEVEDELKLKVMEKEQTIASMQTQIAVLKRKAEQGSQQLQGEVQELELESLLCAPSAHTTPSGRGPKANMAAMCSSGSKVRLETITCRYDPLGIQAHKKVER